MNGKEKRNYLKTLEALLYLANKDSRTYWILKMIWYADRQHLSDFGTTILNDKYIAMSHGPVPSLAYDIVKAAREVTIYNFEDPKPATVFNATHGRTLNPKREANIAFLSESERDHLDGAHAKLSEMSFEQLKNFSHTPAFDAAYENDEIPFEEFAKDLDNGDEVLSYIRSI